MSRIVQRLRSTSVSCALDAWIDYVLSCRFADTSLQFGFCRDKLAVVESSLAHARVLVCEYRHAWKVVATLCSSSRHGHLALISTPERMSASLAIAKAFSCWRENVSLRIRLHEFAEAQLTDLTWGIARLQEDLATSERELQHAHRQAAVFQEEREVASAALAVSLRVGGIDPNAWQMAGNAMAASQQCLPFNRDSKAKPRFEEGIPPTAGSPTTPVRTGKRLHPRVLDSSSRSQPADADSKQPLGVSGLRRHKAATRQEFDLARRNLSQTVSGSPITDSSDGGALRARKNDSAVTGIGARSRETSVVSPRSVFTTRTSANRSSSPQRSSSGGRSAIGQSALKSPLSLAPVSRALEPQLALAEEFDSALASARELLGDGQQLSTLNAEREAKFQRLLEDQQQKEAEFERQFRAGLHFDAAPVALPVASPAAGGVHREMWRSAESSASSPTQAVLTLDEIEAKQKELQAAKFEALLAEQRRRMSGKGVDST